MAAGTKLFHLLYFGIFLTPFSHCSPYSCDIKPDYTGLKKERVVAASAQSVWAVLAEVKTNTTVPAASSKDEAIRHLSRKAVSCFSLLFLVSFSPQG